MTDINKVYEYGKTLLTPDEQQVYDQLAAGVLTLQQSITINTGIDVTGMGKICRYYLEDHAENFFLNNTTPISMIGSYYLNGDTPVYVKYTLTPVYIDNYSASKISEMRQNMNAAAKQMIDAAKNDVANSGLEKALHNTKLKIGSMIFHIRI